VSRTGSDRPRPRERTQGNRAQPKNDRLDARWLLTLLVRDMLPEAWRPPGPAAMVMTLTGHKHFPSAAYSVLQPGAAAFGPVTVAASGKGPYSEEATSWGDYSWATVSPTGEAIWLATEYVPPRSSQTTDGKGNWGTRVSEVLVT